MASTNQSPTVIPLSSEAFIAIRRTFTGTPRTVHLASAASDVFGAPRALEGRPTRLALRGLPTRFTDVVATVFVGIAFTDLSTLQAPIKGRHRVVKNGEGTITLSGSH